MSSDNSGNDAAWQAAGQIGSAGIAAMGQSVGSKRQFERSKQLMELQMQNQERMNETAYARQLQMWKDTNYSAQIQQMREAGVNPALIYGKGGGGGTTVGSNSAGAASGGAAPQIGMDIGSIVQASKMIAELAFMKAQTKKTNEEANSIELDNKVKKTYGNEADTIEASNRRDKALLQGQSLYETEADREKVRQANKAEIEQTILQTQKANLDVEIAKLVKAGTISENEVKAYKAKLAKAEIDPDSNPVIREIMKGMAENGVPLSEIIANIIKMFIK